MTKILIFSLFFLNLILIYFLNKKKIKNFFYKSKIQSVELDHLDQIFLNDQIDKKLNGPKPEVIVKNFCIQGNNNIVGMTSDYEAWIISSLSKISNNYFYKILRHLISITLRLKRIGLDKVSNYNIKKS